jgi:nucleoside-diphosphate-sugar epimerase
VTPHVNQRRVLVTGASGFIGRHTLAPLTERGFQVHAVARRPLRSEEGIWHTADLLERDAAEQLLEEIRPTHLLHLAWYAEHGKFWDAHENLDWVAASLRLLRAFHASGGRRAVIAGSCAEYDWSGDCCDRQTALAPATLYGISKNALRQIFEAYSRSFDLSHAWGRIFFTYGPGEPPTRIIASVARALVSRQRVQCTAGTQVRDFLYVADVADAFAALTDSAVVGAFDIGSGRARALRDLLLRLQELAGRRDLIRFGDLPQRDEPARIVADARRLREDLGWRPTHSLDASLNQTLAWWQANAETGP